MWLEVPVVKKRYLKLTITYKIIHLYQESDLLINPNPYLWNFSKVDLLKTKFGFDDAFNYKEENDLNIALKRLEITYLVNR